MLDRQVTAATVAATVGWMTGVVLVVVDLITAEETGELGLLVAGASAVLQIKLAIRRDQRRREQEAFDLGQRSTDTVRRLR